MDIAERLAALEKRLQTAEDQLEIMRLLNAYGPLVDSGESEAAAELWVEGGGYNFSGGISGGARLNAPDDLIAMYDSEGHKELVNTGSAHLTATPHITVNGDSAEAVAYSFVVLKEGDRWIIWRGAVNHWTFERTPQGWRIVERYNRTLDGSDESHETMRRVMR